MANLDLKLGTFENAINVRLMALEEVTTTFGGRLQANTDAMEMAGRYGDAIKELQDGELATNDTLSELKDKVEESSSIMDREKQDLITTLNAEFKTHKDALGTVVSQARAEFTAVKTQLGELYGQTNEAFVRVKERVDRIEASSAATTWQAPQGGHHTPMAGYLPSKNSIPKVFDGKKEGH